MKRAMKWWQRIDKEYFKQVTLEDTINKRDVFSSNQVLGIADSEAGLLDYKGELGLSLSSGFFENNKIRVLFKCHSPYQVAVGVYSI